MYALSVTIQVRAADVAAFIAATAEQVSRSRQEPGTMRYEVLQSELDPALFVIYEAYRSREDFLAHRAAPHTERWKAATEPMLERPRAAVRGTPLFGQ
jgi:autoinducer 2-degrading protein